MSKTNVTISPAAEEDLFAAWLDIALDNPVAADRQLDRIQGGIEQLALFPQSAPARPDIAPEARSLVIDNYVILYRETADGLEIVRVRPGMTDLSNLLFLPME